MPSTMLEQEDGKITLPATSLAGLRLEDSASAVEGELGGHYRRSLPETMVAGRRDVAAAWTYGILGILCTSAAGPFAVLGVLAANRALKKGAPSARAAQIFNIVIAVLWVLVVVAVFGLGFSLD